MSKKRTRKAAVEADIQLRFAGISQGAEKVEHLQLAEQLFLDAKRGQQAREINRRIRDVLNLG